MIRKIVAAFRPTNVYAAVADLHRAAKRLEKVAANNRLHAKHAQDAASAARKSASRHEARADDHVYSAAHAERVASNIRKLTA